MQAAMPFQTPFRFDQSRGVIQDRIGDRAAIGVGEQIDDLAPFDPQEFAAALTGLDAAA